MAKSQQTFNKKEREKKKQKKRKDKLERREIRKAEKALAPKKTFEEMLSYVDENGNIVDTPPDPSKRKVIKAEDIVLGVPANDHEPIDSVRSGIVKFFNSEKGYGFITDRQSKDSIFVHINSCVDEIRENDKVSFETERGPKGMVAVGVRIEKEKPKVVTPPPAAEGADKPAVDGEAPKTDAPTAESPATEAPKVAATETEAPKVEGEADNTEAKA